MFVNRNWNRTEEDDFKLNVEPLLRDNKEAVPYLIEVIYPPTPTGTRVVGWKIQDQYE